MSFAFPPDHRRSRRPGPAPAWTTKHHRLSFGRRFALAGNAILISCALAACSGSSQEDVRSAAESFASEAAGGDMALQEWLLGKVPTHFAKRAVDSTGEKAAEQMKALVRALVQARQS